MPTDALPSCSSISNPGGRKVASRSAPRSNSGKTEVSRPGGSPATPWLGLRHDPESDPVWGLIGGSRLSPNDASCRELRWARWPPERNPPRQDMSATDRDQGIISCADGIAPARPGHHRSGPGPKRRGPRPPDDPTHPHGMLSRQERREPSAVARGKDRSEIARMSRLGIPEIALGQRDLRTSRIDDAGTVSFITIRMVTAWFGSAAMEWVLETMPTTAPCPLKTGPPLDPTA